ncbi:hypothetical protein AYJ54_32250 [Bradyrhizobium centrolobii]|uniref:Uncharacterized protein n=1 Tax=Bradyrhizobium centrolobii TaxID=1505087 RepID=A0A176Y8A6_9BRAD|nr:hypothetical protein AYJ54_32250 [Bradyrhizobium centrolobii]
MIDGKGLHEAKEATVHVDVVNDDRAAWPQNWPRMIEFKANVTLAVQTVMNEKVNLSKLRQQAGQASPA